MPFKMGLYSPTTIPLNSKKSPRQNCSLQAHGLLSTLLQARSCLEHPSSSAPRVWFPFLISYFFFQFCELCTPRSFSSFAKVTDGSESP